MLPPPEPNMPRVNRRKHARVKVSYSACIRHADRGDDIVILSPFGIETALMKANALDKIPMHARISE
jgi:hypothetical protein